MLDDIKKMFYGREPSINDTNAKFSFNETLDGITINMHHGTKKASINIIDYVKSEEDPSIIISDSSGAFYTSVSESINILKNKLS